MAGYGRTDTSPFAVSEPNLKLRYKPKKSLERRKNPLLRKESAPPSLRRRPAEALGGTSRLRGPGVATQGVGPSLGHVVPPTWDC